MRENKFCGKRTDNGEWVYGCGNIDGMTRIPNSHAHVGIITEFHDNGVFKNNRALYLENNYCPQCGKAYNIL